MNAALQALSNCYAFTSYFLELSKNIQNNLVLTHQFNQHKELNQSMSFNYMKLMKELWQDPNKMDKKLSYSSVTPSELVHTIKLNNPMFRGYMQHDSQEFLIYLMDQLHEELKRPVLVSSGDEKKNVELNKNANNNNGSKTDDEEEDDDKNNEYDETSECENEANTENDEENEEEDDGEDDDDDDLTVVQQKQNIISSSNNIDIDSGVSTMSNNSNMNTNTHNSNNSGDESIDSFETCGDDDDIIKRNDSLATSSDLSDKLHFSDADESMPSTFMNNMKPKFLVNENNNNKTNKKRTSKRNGKIKSKLNANSKAQEQTQSQRPVYTSIVSECFDGKLISQVQCLECNHISTTTETFQHLSLPIPSKEYLQALHNKIVSRHNQLSSSPSKSAVDTSMQYQGWLSWMMDFMKGYIWTPTIKLTECLTAFFSEDDLKGDNMYSCEKCKKLTNGVKYSKILNLPEVLNLIFIILFFWLGEKFFFLVY